MPRPPRIIVAGGLYHVTARGNRRAPIYVDDRDYHRFLSLLAREAARRGWLCRAYCLMPNHFHLVLEACRPNLSEGMQALLGNYARWFNWRRDLDGHVFARRFHAVAVENERHLLELTRYLALNPVRAGLSERADGWRWSSYAATTGTARRPPWLSPTPLLSAFGSDPRFARRRFADFVADGIAV